MEALGLLCLQKMGVLSPPQVVSNNWHHVEGTWIHPLSQEQARVNSDHTALIDVRLYKSNDHEISVSLENIKQGKWQASQVRYKAAPVLQENDS